MIHQSKYATHLIGLLIIALSMVGPGESEANIDDDIASRVIEMTRSQWELDKMRYQIAVRMAPSFADEINYNSHTDSIAITPLTSAKPVGLFPLLIEIFTNHDKNNSKAWRSQMTLNIKVFDSVLVANERIKVGTLVDPSMFKSQWADITRATDKVIKEIEEIKGKRFKRNITEGGMITSSALENIPDVEYGDVVAILLRNGALTIRATGTALQKGYTGETIRVKNTNSRRIVSVVITGPGETTIAIGGRK
ncbi:MAG: flagellar basal body P-ring formation protein FlgA [candidate division Zixibacteria bacterium]|nr:flagellar basal body P-ring formation protein FlgA [candidate division Zixibacteria bacterium]